MDNGEVRRGGNGSTAVHRECCRPRQHRPGRSPQQRGQGAGARLVQRLGRHQHSRPLRGHRSTGQRGAQSALPEPGA
ncbi:hypothetical protein J2S53_004040 [Actinopolyspora lacussalsi]|nr:hypothetical protein [Actinopolyspora lacussalsi]